MLNLRIANSGDFMKKLLTNTTFDTFLLVEAAVKTNISYHISGHLNRDFYDSDELEALSSMEYITWNLVRPHVYNVMKGTKLPLGFKIVLILSDANITRIIEKNNLPLSLSDIANLSLIFHFDGSNILATANTSLKTFTMDKTLERLWDANLLAFFKQQEISVEEL